MEPVILDVMKITNEMRAKKHVNEKSFLVVLNLNIVKFEQKHIVLHELSKIGIIRQQEVSETVILDVKVTTLEMQPQKNVRLILKQGLVQDYPIMQSGMFLLSNKHGMVLSGIPLKKLEF